MTSTREVASLQRRRFAASESQLHTRKSHLLSNLARPTHRLLVLCDAIFRSFFGSKGQRSTGLIWFFILRFPHVSPARRERL